jgi:hypothetical protein
MQEQYFHYPDLRRYCPPREIWESHIYPEFLTSKCEEVKK